MRIFLQKCSIAAVVVCLSAQPLSAKDRILDVHHFGFGGGSDGVQPEAPPAIDPQGNLFGTTAFGGGKGCGGEGCGVVYEVSPVQGGGWSESVLYSFQGATDGLGTRAMFARDPSGALYGSDAVGQFDEDSQVYRLSPPVTGEAWSLSVLYVFDHTQGIFLDTDTPLIYRQDGIYGLTTNTSGGGTLFRLTPPQDGTTWVLNTLFTFTNEGTPTSAASSPDGQTIYVAIGNSVVSVSPPQAKGGGWTQTLLYEFKGGRDGEGPASIVAGGDGAIYGTADLPEGRSIAFALTSDGSHWRKTTLKTFGRLGEPVLTWSPSGSLYGTSYGDQDTKPGSAFRLDPPMDRVGRWTYVELANFRRGPSENPIGLTLDARGRVFGTLEGQYDGGAVFELRNP
jgi:hypothetical protein